MILTTNDGKGKHQSWEAVLAPIEMGTYMSNGAIYGLTGYGATEEEAISNLKQIVLTLSKVLETIDFTLITSRNA